MALPPPVSYAPQSLTLGFGCSQNPFPSFHTFAQHCAGSMSKQPLVLLCLSRNCYHPKMLHAGLRCWASLLTGLAQVVEEGKAEGRRKIGISYEASEMQHRVV